MTLVVAGEVAALIVGVGGVFAVLQRTVKMMRRVARFLDGWFGDGTAKHPSAVDRLAAIEAKLDQHVLHEVPTMLAEGQAWGGRLDASVASLDRRVAALEVRVDPVVGSK